MFKICVFFLILFNSINFCFSQEISNKFISRKYWTSNPSIEAIKKDIQLGNDPTELNEYNFDPVTWAILENVSNETIIFLINLNGNGINKKSHDGRPPIFWAAYKDNIELMEYLIKKNARIDIIDDHGYSLVNFAATTGQLNKKIYELCKSNGLKFNEQLNNDGASPLLLLIPHMPSSEMIDYFTINNLDITQTDKYGNNAFVYASKTGNIKIMNYLVEKGLNTRVNNDAAVIYASKGTRKKRNSIDTYKYLKKLGLSINVKDSKGRTALHYVANYSSDTSLYRYLIDNNLSTNARDSIGMTPFLYSVQNNSIEGIKILIEEKTNVNVKNSKGENALHIAVKRKNKEIINNIIKEIKNINEKTNEGMTALHISAMNSKNNEILKTLLKHGADKKLKTNFNETAFMLAKENELLNNTPLNFLK